MATSLLVTMGKVVIHRAPAPARKPSPRSDHGLRVEVGRGQISGNDSVACSLKAGLAACDQALAFASQLNQHDIYAYMQLFGGPRIFERKLYELFTTSSVVPRGCAAGHCRHGRSVRARQRAQPLPVCLHRRASQDPGSRQVVDGREWPCRQRGMWPDERMESVCGRSAARRSFTGGGFAQLSPASIPRIVRLLSASRRSQGNPWKA